MKDPNLLSDLSVFFKSLVEQSENFITRIDAELDPGKPDDNIYVEPGDDLAEVLKQLHPGDKIVIKEGHYPDVEFLILASGTPEQPITITAQGKVTIDCLNYLSVKGSDVTLNGLEVYSDSWSDDRFTTAQRFDFSIEGKRTVIKNCIIHDFGNVGLWSNATDSVMEGCLVYNIGRGGNSQGHSLYTQNSTGLMTIRNNIFLVNYDSAFCLHLYGSGNAQGLRGYLFDHNVFYGGRNYMGSGGQKISDVNLNNNLLIRGNMELGAGWPDEPLHEVSADGNVMWDSAFNIKKAGIFNLTKTHAIFPGGMQGGITNVTGGDIDYNHYIFYGNDRGVAWNRYNYNYVYAGGPDALQIIRDGTPFEDHSTEELYFGALPHDELNVNVYDPHRAIVSIANYNLSDKVKVDLSGLTNGLYRAYNAQNPSEGFDFTYTGAPVEFPMIGWTNSRPIGVVSMRVIDSMLPKFGIFYITAK